MAAEQTQQAINDMQAKLKDLERQVHQHGVDLTTATTFIKLAELAAAGAFAAGQEFGQQ